MGKLTIPMAIFNSYVSHYQRQNLHFPMVFLWFSYGFPLKSSVCITLPAPKKHHGLPVLPWAHWTTPAVPRSVGPLRSLVYAQEQGDLEHHPWVFRGFLLEDLEVSIAMGYPQMGGWFIYQGVLDDLFHGVFIIDGLSTNCWGFG